MIQTQSTQVDRDIPKRRKKKEIIKIQKEKKKRSKLRQ